MSPISSPVCNFDLFKTFLWPREDEMSKKKVFLGMWNGMFREKKERSGGVGGVGKVSYWMGQLQAVSHHLHEL